MTRQRPFSDDLAAGTPTAGLVPVSAGAGAPAAWGTGSSPSDVLYDNVLAAPGSFDTGVLPTGVAYAKLRVHIQARCAANPAGFTTGDLAMQFNSSADQVYAQTMVGLSGAGVLWSIDNTPGGETLGDYNAVTFELGWVPGEDRLAGRASEFEVVIYNYRSTVFFKQIHWAGSSLAPGTGNQEKLTLRGSGEWAKTDAIISIQVGIIDAVTNLLVGSRITVCGEGRL